jgi:hypothetical protein
MLKTTVALASLVLLVSSTSSQAQEVMMMKDGTMMMMAPDGRMSRTAVPDKMLSDTILKEGKVVTASQLVMMHGGKVYMIEDQKMSDGKMMSEHMMTAR